jgi:hypothetical protein
MNNFDVSRTGENIEFNCFYDSDLAQILYNEFESENTRLDFGRDNTLFLIGDVSAPYYSRLDLLALSKQALFNLCLDYELIGYSAELNDYKKSEYIADLLNISIERHYKHLLANSTWHGLSEKIAHDYYISKGYSQGDAVYIVSIDKPIDNSLRRCIDNILWDSPISMYANVNGSEFDTDDFLNDDFYKYDTEAISENIARLPISDYAKAWLIKALPKWPNY